MVSTPVNPGAGAYILGTSPTANINKRQVTLSKISGRLHDAVWKHFFKYCEYVLAFTDSVTSPLEYRLISVLVRSSRELGADWPSRLRNAVNYYPGLSYKLKNTTGPCVLPRRRIYKGRYSISDIIDLMENTLSLLSCEKDVVIGIEHYGSLLVCCCYLTFALADDLFFEVFERHDIRRQNAITKKTFRTSVGIIDIQSGMMWPFKS